MLDFYVGLLDGLGVVRSDRLDDCGDGQTVLVAGVKVATQTPAVRSGQRIIFATLDDAADLVDLAFFEPVQDRCAARLFGSWLLLACSRIRRAALGPVAISLNATECWDIPELEEIRASRGRWTRCAPRWQSATCPARHPFPRRDARRSGCQRIRRHPPGGLPVCRNRRPGGSLKNPPRTLWHASPGSPDGLHPRIVMHLVSVTVAACPEMPCGSRADERLPGSAEARVRYRRNRR